MNVAKSAASMPVSLTRYLLEEQRARGQISADLRLPVEVVARSCVSISIAVGKDALGGAPGTTRYHREATTG